jgi:hypothetical protein
MSLGIIEDRWFGVPPEAVDETFPFPPPQVGENARGFCKAFKEATTIATAASLARVRLTMSEISPESGRDTFPAIDHRDELRWGRGACRSSACRPPSAV